MVLGGLSKAILLCPCTTGKEVGTGKDVETSVNYDGEEGIGAGEGRGSVVEERERGMLGRFGHAERMNNDRGESTWR